LAFGSFDQALGQGQKRAQLFRVGKLPQTLFILFGQSDLARAKVRRKLAELLDRGGLCLDMVARDALQQRRHVVDVPGLLACPLVENAKRGFRAVDAHENRQARDLLLAYEA
jgi:hypothetical protein